MGCLLLRNLLFSLRSPLLTFRSSPIIIFPSQTPSPQKHTHIKGQTAGETPERCCLWFSLSRLHALNHRITFYEALLLEVLYKCTVLFPFFSHDIVFNSEVTPFLGVIACWWSIIMFSRRFFCSLTAPSSWSRCWCSFCC